MTHTYEDKFNKEFTVDCKKCFGLCCTALYFSASDGFPNDKEAGKPCVKLQSDFSCSIHKSLRDRGLKGCTAYDCLGAGQKVAQVTCGGHDWRQSSESSKKMFDAFLIMRQLHEMLWYLTQAAIIQTDNDIKEKISLLMDDIEQLTLLDLDSLLVLEVEKHRTKVNKLLKITSEKVRAKARSGKKAGSRRLDYFGRDLRKTNLRGADLRGACLIAANLRGVDLSGSDLIAADLRDADISGANLANSIFLTQAQINTAKGNSSTKLPMMLTCPNCWPK